MRPPSPDSSGSLRPSRRIGSIGRAGSAADGREFQLTSNGRVVSPRDRLAVRGNALIESGFSSALLVACTLLSLVLANIPATSAFWVQLWDLPVGPAIGGHALSLRGWINEGLMSFFFFGVGLEIKKEVIGGSLSSRQTASLPCVAALGGMLVPMGVYWLLNRVSQHGIMAAGFVCVLGGGFGCRWVGELGVYGYVFMLVYTHIHTHRHTHTLVTVPMATDIAFAVGVYGFFKDRMPAPALTFLLTLATGVCVCVCVCVCLRWRLGGLVH